MSDNPPEPPNVLQYSSFTLSFSGLNLYFACLNRSSLQVPRIPKSVESFRGLGAFFRLLHLSIGYYNCFIFVGEFP